MSSREEEIVPISKAYEYTTSDGIIAQVGKASTILKDKRKFEVEIIIDYEDTQKVLGTTIV